MTALAAAGPSTAFSSSAAKAAPVSMEADELPVAEKVFSTAQELLTSYDRYWDSDTRTYKNVPFDEAEFTRVASANHTAFPLNYDLDTEFGVIEKKVVNAGSKIFVRADLHGDLKSLLENLKSLYEQGLLDETFKCRPNVHLVFLGDYVDRGKHSLQVLQLLLTIRMENKGQVTLIRGNHEDTDINMYFCGQDPHFRNFLFKGGTLLYPAHRALLKQIYQTMPLCVYLGEQVTSGEIQYVMVTHGAFELHVDPFELLKPKSTLESLAAPMIPVGKKPAELFSSRVAALVPPPAERNYRAELAAVTDKVERKRIKQAWAAHCIHTLALGTRHDFLATAYNWGDMQVPGVYPSDLYILTSREWKISAADVKHYLRLISMPGSHAVKLIFRGHQHETQHHEHNGKVVVTTLPVGMDVGYYSADYPGQLDTAYVLTTGPKVKDWTKEAMFRPPGDTGMRIESPYPIRDTKV